MMVTVILCWPLCTFTICDPTFWDVVTADAMQRWLINFPFFLHRFWGIIFLFICCTLLKVLNLQKKPGVWARKWGKKVLKTVT